MKRIIEIDEVEFEILKKLLVNLMMESKQMETPVFFPTKYERKCSRCESLYRVGDYIFRMNDKYWCEVCATDEERELSNSYKNFIKRMNHD